MTRKEYLSAVEACEINDARVEEVEKIYSKIPDLVKKMLSYSTDSIFFDDGYRTLSMAEIMDAEKDLHINFAEKNMMPVADCGENDFIVYHSDTGIWSKFNIVDESMFKRKNSLADLF